MENNMATITAEELKSKLDAGGVLILDVREPFEFSDWHIPGAINIPISRVMRNPEIEAPKDSEIIAVCAHGMRSAAAVRYLQMAGFENVSSLQGGMVEWNGVYDTVSINDKIIQVRRVGKGCLSYVISSEGEAVIIDPTIDVDFFIALAEENGCKIISVLDTHAHADHASGGRLIAKKLAVPYYAPDEVGKAASIKEGDEISIGSLSLAAIAAPGHTPGSLCYHVGRFLFTGDTLFVDAVGRPDLGQNPEESAPILYDSIQRLLAMPDETIVLPAHTEIANIKQESPLLESIEELREIPLLKKSKDQFVTFMIESRIPTPENFEIIKEFNTGKIVIDTLEEFRELEAGANRCGVK